MYSLTLKPIKFICLPIILANWMWNSNQNIWPVVYILNALKSKFRYYGHIKIVLFFPSTFLPSRSRCCGFSFANKFYRQMWWLILNHTVQVKSYKEFNLKGWMKTKNVFFFLMWFCITDILNIKKWPHSRLSPNNIFHIKLNCDEMTILCDMWYTYRRMEVKYWSKKFFACSIITSALRISFWATWKLAPNITLPIQTDRLQANGWFGACKEIKWKIKYFNSINLLHVYIKQYGIQKSKDIYSNQCCQQILAGLLTPHITTNIFSNKIRVQEVLLWFSNYPIVQCQWNLIINVVMELFHKFFQHNN